MKANIIQVTFGGPDIQLGARRLVSVQKTECSIVKFDCLSAPAKSPAEYSVALVAGGAVLGFDHQVHIDLDRTHTVLSPDDARLFASELKKIADAIDPLLQSG
jgi:hypothetical protein